MLQLFTQPYGLEDCHILGRRPPTTSKLQVLRSQTVNTPSAVAFTSAINSRTLSASEQKRCAVQRRPRQASATLPLPNVRAVRAV